jgi:hypothetical protein
MSVREIRGHLEELNGIDVLPDVVSPFRRSIGLVLCSLARCSLGKDM